MKHGSLQTLRKGAEPKFTTGKLIGLQNSPKSSLTYVVTEGIWDSRLYSRLLNTRHVNVGVSSDEKGNSSCHIVQNVVHTVRQEKQSAKVIGIIDRDYTRYRKGKGVCIPEDLIYRTDEHSLEMLLLKSDRVKELLKEHIDDFDKHFPNILKDARHVAMFYVHNENRAMAFDFKEHKMHLVNFYDDTAKAMKADWKTRLSEKYNHVTGCKHTDVHNLTMRLGVDNESDYVICRGHDVFDVLYKKHKGGIGQDDIMWIMVRAYTSSDFEATQLAKDLHTLEKNKGWKLF